MKTFLCVYTPNIDESEEELRRKKKYTFNTNFDIKKRDILRSPTYNSYLVVVMVLPKHYIYYNIATGELSETFNSSQQYEIRELEVVEDIPEFQEDKIYAKLLNREVAVSDKKIKITL